MIDITMRVLFILRTMCSDCNPLSRLEKVTDHLEGLIDPFDLDVFTPHLNNNLSRLVQRTSVSRGKGMHSGKDHGLRGSNPCSSTSFSSTPEGRSVGRARSLSCERTS